MIVKRFKIGDLAELIHSEWYRNSVHLPISPERVISQIHNPFANSNDEVLYLLLDKEQLIAYRLVLPSFIRNQKMAWLSCVWVHPKYRRLGYGKKLTKLALEYWNDRLIGTNFAPKSQSMYKNAMDFNLVQVLDGYRYYNRFYFKALLPKKNRNFRYVKPFLGLGDFIGNLLLNFQKKIDLNKEITVQRLEFIDKESLKFIQSFQNEEHSPRTKEEWDWIVKYPWVIQGESTSISKRYHFSNRSKKFDFHLYKIFKKSALIGCLWITIHGDFMKTPYLYFEHENVSFISNFIQSLAQKHQVKAITCFYSKFNDYLTTQKHIFYHQKQVKRSFLAAKGIQLDIHKVFKDGDGDAVFT